MPEITFNRHTIISFPGSNISDIDEGIVNGSLAIREILCADRIVFGDINANQFQCQLYDCPNLLKKKIQVKQVDNGTTKVVFTGWVTSCKTDDLTGFKSIEAYDYFYKARTKKIKKWWKEYWTDRTQSTIGAMWRSMLTYYNISYVETSLMFDSVVIKKKNAKKLKTSYMTTLLNQLCEINMCVPNMDRGGSLEFKKFASLTEQSAIDVRGSYVISTSKFEEETAVPYDKVELYTEKNASVESAGTGDNVLSIQNNVFLYGLTSDELHTMADTMLGNMYTIEYTTGNITMKVSNLDIHLGDVLRVEDKNGNARYCIVCENNYKGSLLVDQSVTSNYEDDPNIEHGVYGNTLARNTDRLEYNLDLKPDTLSGSSLPSDSLGKVGDIYFKDQINTTYSPIHPIVNDGYVTEDETQWTFVRPNDMAKIPRDGFKWDKEHGGYNFNCFGMVYKNIGTVEPDSHALASGWFGVPAFKIDVPIEWATYKISCTVTWECTDLAGWYYVGLSTWTNDTDCSSGNPALLLPFTGISEETNYECTYDFHPGLDWSEDDSVYMYLDMYFPFQATIPGKAHFEISVKNLIIEKVLNTQTGETDTGLIPATEEYIDDMYTKLSSSEDDAGNSSWQKVDTVQKVDQSEFSGLSYDRPEPNAQKTLSLTPEVMRAWVKADPPQIKRTFNQYCVRYTGKPDTAIDIILQSNTGWLNKSIKKDSEGVFTVKSGGTVSSGDIEYCAYKLTGLISGQRYYFNLKCNFKDGTTFGNDYTKGLGLVFNTTGIINTDDWTGDPNTFDAENLYYSMPRKTSAFFANFDFVATASTMYMCVVVADIANGETSSLTLSRFVISKTEKAYIRNFYLYDTETEDWLQYKPWGSGDEGGEGGASSLADLDDVHLDNIQNGQSLYYDVSTGEWKNGNMPVASANSLGGIKVGNNLEIDANGVLSATASSEVELVELTQAEYDLLTPEEKNDPNTIYFVKDAGGSGGGGGGASSEIIQITNGTDTSTRTFTFSQTPKRISVTYNSTDNWLGNWSFIWGDPAVTGNAYSKQRPVMQGAYSCIELLSYGSDGKSFTITGHNAFGAWNMNGGYGQMYVEY